MNYKAFAVVLILGLVMTGCQPSTVISTLEAVVAAAEVALPVIGAAAGISPQILAGIVSYLQLVDVAITRASVILAGAGTPAQKSADIAAAFAAIAAGCDCIPPGTPKTVVAVVNAVIKAVSKFLYSVGAGPHVKGIAPTVPAEIKISEKDRVALGKIRERAKTNMTKLKEVTK